MPAATAVAASLVRRIVANERRTRDLRLRLMDSHVLSNLLVLGELRDPLPQGQRGQLEAAQMRTVRVIANERRPASRVSDESLGKALAVPSIALRLLVRHFKVLLREGSAVLWALLQSNACDSFRERVIADLAERGNPRSVRAGNRQPEPRVEKVELLADQDGRYPGSRPGRRRLAGKGQHCHVNTALAGKSNEDSGAGNVIPMSMHENLPGMESVARAGDGSLWRRPPPGARVTIRRRAGHRIVGIGNGLVELNVAHCPIEQPFRSQ